MGNNPSIEGTAGADNIVVGYIDADGDAVTDGTQQIHGLAGNDRIVGGAGIDIIHGGDDDDRIKGVDGNDLLYGDAGNDWISGGSDDDRIYGGDGDDLLEGDGGADKIQGDAGNDTIHGGNGHDLLYGNKGNNEIYGEKGNDFLSSGDHTSTLDGGEGDDTLELRTKKGADHVATGGDGADLFQFVQLNQSAVSDITITDYELGIDSFTVDGVDGAAYLASAGAGAVTDSGGSALLTLDTGDTILFENLTESALETFFGL